MPTDTVAGRFQELGALWHAWRAAILEDFGDLPPKFEDIILEVLRSELEKHAKTLEEALSSCNTTLATLSQEGSAPSHSTLKPVKSKPLDERSSTPSA